MVVRVREVAGVVALMALVYAVVAVALVEVAVVGGVELVYYGVAEAALGLLAAVVIRRM